VQGATGAGIKIKWNAMWPYGRKERGLI